MHGHILVTGANGFVGRNVARHFSRQGHTVLGIGHGEWPREEWRAWGLSNWHRADVTLDALLEYAGTPSVTVHCAGGGSVSYAISDPLADFNKTVGSTAHLLEYIRRFAPSCRVVYPSSASVYGTVEKLPIHEDCRIAPISQYGVHKMMAEQMVVSYGRQFNISAAIVRFFSVYGAGLRKQLLWDACLKFANHDSIFMGTGNEIRDWLHVEDAAELLFAASKQAGPECPIVNGGSGEGISVRDVLVHLSTCFGMADPPAFSGALRTGDPSRFIADIEGAKQWGWSPSRDWKEAMEEYVAWWMKDAR
jgi:UDP-glucose 4-epimerase